MAKIPHLVQYQGSKRNLAPIIAGYFPESFIPLYKREKITDDLHEACGFRTDYQFITKSKMRTIQKKSKGKE